MRSERIEIVGATVILLAIAGIVGPILFSLTALVLDVEVDLFPLARVMMGFIAVGVLGAAILTGGVVATEIKDSRLHRL